VYACDRYVHPFTIRERSEAVPTRPTKPPAPALLRQAAIMRAHGQAWEAVAKDVGLSVRTVQLWPQLHPRRWAKATTMAQTELTDEAVAESMRTLRRQLRSEDDKVGRDAAQKLLAYGTAVRKAKAAKPSVRRKPPGEFSRIAAYLEGLTDAECQALLGEPAGESEVPTAVEPAKPRRRRTAKSE